MALRSPRRPLSWSRSPQPPLSPKMRVYSLFPPRTETRIRTQNSDRLVFKLGDSRSGVVVRVASRQSGAGDDAWSSGSGRTKAFVAAAGDPAGRARALPAGSGLRSVGRDDAVDLVMPADRTGRDAGERENVALVVLGEGQHVGHRAHARHRRLVQCPLAVGALRPDEDLAIHGGEPFRPVAEDVLAGPRRMRAAVDIAAGDRDSQASLRYRGAVVVDQDRVGQPVLVARGRVGVRVDVVEALVAFHPAPAVVAALLDDVDFLDRILLDVGAEQLLVAAHVEGAAPRVAQAVGPDLRQGVVAADEGIVGRN